MPQEFTVQDAFSDVLDRLISSEVRIAGARALVDEARQESAEQRARADRVLAENAALRKQNDCIDEIHDLLVRIKARSISPISFSHEEDVALTAALNKAIDDTDPIPF